MQLCVRVTASPRHSKRLSVQQTVSSQICMQPRRKEHPMVRPTRWIRCFLRRFALWSRHLRERHCPCHARLGNGEKENRLTWCRGKRASCRLLLVEKKWETDQNPGGCRLSATIPRTGSLTGGSPVSVQPEHAIHECTRWQDTPLTPHFWWSARYPNGTPQSATRMEKA